LTRVQRLTWDDWNVLHIARHEVTPDEVEQVCHGNPSTDSSHSNRLLVTGPTVTGRVLTVILAPAAGPAVYYPVTARPASKKERRRFDERQGGQT